MVGTAPARKTNISSVWVGRNITENGPSTEIVTRILTDAVNQKYKERIEMVVD